MIGEIQICDNDNDTPMTIMINRAMADQWRHAPCLWQSCPGEI
jgi:hypothetical protein